MAIMSKNRTMFKLSHYVFGFENKYCCLFLINKGTLLYDQPSYLLTPWCTVLLEKLTGLQLVKKFPAFLWNPTKVHYRTRKRPPPVPILGQPNPVRIPTSHLLEIHPNIIHPSTRRSPQWSLLLRFPPPRPYTPPSPHPYAPHAQPISFFSILSPATYIRYVIN